MIDWPPNLIEDLARRRAVIIIGSGVSRQSVSVDGRRPPIWKNFLMQALADCPGGDSAHIEKAIEVGDLLHACEWLKKKYDEQWNTYLRRIFQEPGFPPADLHREIIKLDSRLVFSLNFDDIYERAANEIKSGSHIIKQYHESGISEFLRGNGRYVVKVHGSLHSPERLIFTQADYARARTRYSAFYQAFDACLLTHSFLFIGAGYSDPDVNLVLENQAFSFPTSSPHYFLTGAHEHVDRKESLRNNRNLKTIEYDKIDDNHSGLVAEIRSLVELVDQSRDDLTRSTNW